MNPASLLPSPYIGSTSAYQTPSQQLLNNPGTVINTGQAQLQGSVLGATDNTPYDAGTTSGSATAPAPAVVDPSIYQYYDALTGNVQSQLNRLPGQLQVGQQNVNDSYTSALNQLLGQKGVADRNYNTSKDQTLQDNVAAQGDIQFQTGQQTNALQRLLGSAGFGSSLASQQAVPYATGLVGANQTRQVQNTFGRNQQALDTNYNDYLGQYNNSTNDLGHQRDVQNNNLQSSIDQNKASLLSQLSTIAQQRASAQPGATYANVVAAMQPYQSQINSLGGQIDQLGQQYAHPVLQAAPATYNAPSLQSYNYDQAPGVQVGGAPGAASNLGSFATLLNGGQQQQKQTNLAGQATLA